MRIPVCENAYLGFTQLPKQGKKSGPCSVLLMILWSNL